MNIIQFLYTLPGIPLGYLLFFIYKFISSNVGIAILIFTLVVKVAMLPLSIKQQKNQAKSQMFMPMVQEIQKKYANNREKQQEEVMKLQQQGYKPMGGCGSMLLSFLILFGVIDVVYKPLTHIEHMNSAKISSFVEESYNVEITSFITEEVALTDSEVEALDDSGLAKHKSVLMDAQKLVDYYNAHCLKDEESEIDISVFKELNVNTVKIVKTAMSSAMKAAYAEDTGLTLFTDTDMYKITDAEKAELETLETDAEKDEYKAEHSFGSYMTNMLNTARTHYGNYKVTGEDSVTFQPINTMQRELYALDRFGTETDKFRCRDAYSEAVLNTASKESMLELYDNLNFIGIKLGQVPKENMHFPMLLVPIVSFIMAFLQTFITNKINAKTNPAQAEMAGMGAMKIMMYVMPLISLWIAFTVPAGAGFYWTVSYVFGIIQTLLLNKLFNPIMLREQAEAEWKAQYGNTSKKKDKSIDVDAVKVVDENGKEETVSQKELNRRKLAAARKAQAEKYGEEYHDDDE